VKPWMFAIIFILVVLAGVVVVLLLAEGNQEVTTALAMAGLGTGGAMAAVGAALLRQQQAVEATGDAAVLNAIRVDDPDLARLLDRIDAQLVGGES